MTIKDCIDIVDNIKPNQYTIKEKVMWLSFLDEIIINEVLKTHEGYDGRYDDFGGYSDDKISVTLIVPSPYDRLYTAYLKMKIDQENGETARYNNSKMLYNTYMMEYRKHYNKTHMPLDTIGRRKEMPMPRTTSGLTDAEYENLKRDMTYILTEYFSNAVSDDKLTDIVTKFVQNNIEMIRDASGLVEVANKVAPSPASIKLYADRWVQSKNEQRWHQEVVVSNATITKYSKIDLQLSAEQIMIFYEKDLAFVTENDGGKVTVYCIGQVPENDYVIQATVSEVVINA
jgi:hypothetical protein